MKVVMVVKLNLQGVYDIFDIDVYLWLGVGRQV